MACRAPFNRAPVVPVAGAAVRADPGRAEPPPILGYRWTRWLDWRISTPLVKIKVRTLYIPGQVCLLSRYSLGLTCVVCLELENEQLYSFRARGD